MTNRLVPHRDSLTRVGSPALWVVFAVAAASGVLAAQQQGAAPAPTQTPPAVTFRVEVNYVEVDATVVDAQGRVVSDLTAADFDA